MADLLTKVRRDIDRRLEELSPVFDEFRRLEQARDALAMPNTPRRRRRAGGAGSPSTRARIIKGGNPTHTRARMTKAQSHEIDRRVLALLAENSAQKPAALAVLTETSVGSMNSRLNRLAREGKLKKRKRGNAVRYSV